MSTQGVSTRKEAEGLLIRKAQENPAFRKELVAEPGKTIEKTFGVRLPPGMEVSILEETDRQVYLVLPVRSAGSARGELAEKELAAVAGGAQKEKDDSNFFGKLGASSEKASAAAD
jgi:hypothetical protein